MFILLNWFEPWAGPIFSPRVDDTSLRQELCLSYRCKFSVTFILSSANAFNLNQCTILSFGKGLMGVS